jgi:hypothetical protein
VSNPSEEGDITLQALIDESNSNFVTQDENAKGVLYCFVPFSWQ